MSGWHRIGGGRSWWRGPLYGVGLGLERLEPLRLALPSLPCDLFVGRWSERVDQMLGRIRLRPLELLQYTRGLLPARIAESGDLARRVAWAQRASNIREAGEWLAFGQVDREPLCAVEGLADAGVALAVGGDPLRVATDPVLVGAVGAEVLAGDLDAVAVDRAGVADVGLLLGLTIAFRRRGWGLLPSASSLSFAAPRTGATASPIAFRGRGWSGWTSTARGRHRDGGSSR